MANQDKFVIVQDMPDQVKLNYLRVMVDFVRSSHSDVDADHLAELQILMSQLNFSPKLRQEIRSYLQTAMLPLDAVLSGLDSNVPTGSEEVLHISLIKDLIRFLRIRNKQVEIADDFIHKVADIYDINSKQIAVLKQACINDEEIMAGKVDDDMITRNAKDLAAKAAAVGVPVAAVYLSGSVVGLSAAGITSGLAALGLGGILGLSAMVTGIGIVVLIGVASYTGVRWITGGSKREKVTKREFLIQEIIKLNQKAISNLVEDINYFGGKIVELTRSDEINRSMIEKLASELTLFSKAVDSLQTRGVKLEKVSVREKG